MNYFPKTINDLEALNIFGKSSIIDIWKGSEYFSGKSTSLTYTTRKKILQKYTNTWQQMWQKLFNISIFF